MVATKCHHECAIGGQSDSYRQQMWKNPRSTIIEVAHTSLKECLVHWEGPQHVKGATR